MRQTLLLFAAAVILMLAVGTVSAVTETVVMKDYIVDFEYDDADVKSGETFRLAATVTNDAGETRSNIEISLDPDSPFDTVGDDSKLLGSLDDGETKTVSFRVEVDEDATSGDYALDFKIEDNEDDDSDEFDISVESDKANLIIGDVASLPTIIAPDLDDVKLTLTIENTDDEDAEFVRAKLVLPRGFSPSGSYSDVANLGTISGKSSKDVDFFIDSAEDVESGLHKGTLELEYEENGDPRSKTLEFDLPVKGRPQFEVTRTSTTPSLITEKVNGELRITVENIGEEKAEETSVRVFENSDQPFNFEEKTNFIGDLMPHESGTATLKFNVDSGATEKTYLVRMQIRTVNNGNVLVEEMSVPVKVSASEGSNWMYYVIGFSVLLLIVLVVLIFRIRR